MKLFASALKGAAALAIAHLTWSGAAILLGCSGARFAASSDHPSFLQVALQQTRDFILPFFPGALLTGLILGPVVCHMSRLRAAALGVAAAPTSFLLTIIVMNAFRAKFGGYAAEQGMAAVAYLVVPIIGLTASAFWAAAAVVLAWPRKAVVPTT